MKRGHSYFTVTQQNINHVLVKALLTKGFKKFTLTYASTYSTNSGWSCDGVGLPDWLGYTKKEALIIIEKLQK